jgi:hypothetical protein
VELHLDLVELVEIGVLLRHRVDGGRLGGDASRRGEREDKRGHDAGDQQRPHPDQCSHLHNPDSFARCPSAPSIVSPSRRCVQEISTPIFRESLPWQHPSNLPGTTLGALALRP